MSRIFVILGNGFTIDFLQHFTQVNQDILNKIDVANLFRFGDIITPPWNRLPGMLSYKNTPNLWKLGARCSISSEESNALIEEILTCANMFFDFVNDDDQKDKRLEMIDNANYYLLAYSELLIYLRQLFSYYNDLITNEQLNEFITSNSWGWINFFRRLSSYKDITFVTYNYDIWLERILKTLSIPFEIYGFSQNQKNNKSAKQEKNKIEIIKPHGSISFVSRNNVNKNYAINYNVNIDAVKLEDYKLEYTGLGNYDKGLIIPPAGDSSRLSHKAIWSESLRKAAEEEATKIDSQDYVILCGMSYGHVDRKELDTILLNLDQNSNFTFINPSPPRDLNAVLMTIFKNYILLSNSDKIGEIFHD